MDNVYLFSWVFIIVKSCISQKLTPDVNEVIKQSVFLKFLFKLFLIQ